MSKIFRCLLCLFLAGCSVSEGQYAFVSDRPLKLSNLTGKGGAPVSWAQALSRQHVVALVPFSEAPSPQAAVALILREYCKRTHGLISCYRWFDYFGQLYLKEFIKMS